MQQVNGNPKGTDPKPDPDHILNAVPITIFGPEVGAVAVKLMTTLGTNLNVIKEKTVQERGDAIRLSIVHALVARSNPNFNPRSVIWFVAIAGFQEATNQHDSMPYMGLVAVAMLLAPAKEETLRPEKEHQNVCSIIFEKFLAWWKIHSSLQDQEFRGAVSRITTSLSSENNDPTIRVARTEVLYPIMVDISRALSKPGETKHPAELYAFQAVAYLFAHPIEVKDIWDFSHLIHNALSSIFEISNHNQAQGH